MGDPGGSQDAGVRSVAPREAWSLLENNPQAVLVDVRTRAEWAFVGLPDVSALGKDVILLEWQGFPDMQQTRGFADLLAGQIPDRRNDPILFLCRSGARSLAAAQTMAVAGYTDCINIAEGFEGDLDGDRRRGRVNGWKAAGLPWRQT